MITGTAHQNIAAYKRPSKTPVQAFERHFCNMLVKVHRVTESAIQWELECGNQRYKLNRQRNNVRLLLKITSQLKDDVFQPHAVEEMRSIVAAVRSLGMAYLACWQDAKRQDYFEPALPRLTSIYNQMGESARLIYLWIYPHLEVEYDDRFPICH